MYVQYCTALGPVQHVPNARWGVWMYIQYVHGRSGREPPVAGQSEATGWRQRFRVRWAGLTPWGRVELPERGVRKQ